MKLKFKASLDVWRLISTAEDLFRVLSQIPQSTRDRLPIILVVDGQDYQGSIQVDAFEDTESEDEMERGFRLSSPDSD